MRITVGHLNYDLEIVYEEHGHDVHGCDVL